MSADYKYDCALLIDDDSTDIYIHTRVLELSRFAKKIVVKKTSREALAYLKDETHQPENIPDIVFLDYFMPVTSGKEFLDKFRELPEAVTEKSKVVMLSVLDQESHPAAFNRKHVYEAITKPLTEEKLLNI